MPIEIRELIIKATIDNGNNSGESSSSTPTSGGEDQQLLIQRCVAEVMRIIKKSQER